MDTSTNPTPSSKRVRIDAMASEPTSSRKDDSTRKPPKALAESFIRSHVASLQPQLATILEKLGIQHLNLLAKADNKDTMISKMESDPAFIPRSARLDFTLHMSKKAEATAEYHALHEETEKLLQSIRLGLKRQVIAATKIEYNVLRQEIRLDLARSLRIITRAFLIGDSDETDVDNKVFALIDNCHESLLVHANIERTAFLQLYKETHNLENFPSNSQQSPSSQQSPFFASIADSESATVLTSNHGSQSSAASTFYDVKLKRAIESVFVAPWNQYLDQVKRNTIALELKKFSTSHFSEQNTEAAAMLVDEEPAADRQLLIELIKKETQAETKALQKEVKQLRAQLKTLDTSDKTPKGPDNNQKGRASAKNQQRGRSSGGASTKKEIAAKRQSSKPSRSPSLRRQKSNRNNRDDTDASDGASQGESAGRRRNYRNRDPKRRQRNRSNSKTKRNWRSNRSRRESA
jgi:hypothetical protein